MMYQNAHILLRQGNVCENEPSNVPLVIKSQADVMNPEIQDVMRNPSLEKRYEFILQMQAL